MKKEIVKIVCVMLWLLLGLQITGCGRQTENTTTKKEYVYVPEYQKIELQEGMEQAIIKGDMIYFQTGQYDETVGSYVQMLGTLRIGESAPKLSVLELEPDVNLNGMCINESGNMLSVVTQYGYDEIEQMPVMSKIELCEFDLEGKKVSGIDLLGELGDEGEIYLQGLETDAEGNLYLGCEQKVWVLDKSGKLLCKLELAGWMQNMFSAKDGRIMVVYYGEERLEVHPLEWQEQKVGEALDELIVTDYGNYMFTKGLDTDVLYSVDNNIYTFNFKEKEPELLLSWIDCDIDPDQVRAFGALEDGRLLAATSSWGENGSEVELIYLTRKKGSEVPEKKILTLGTLSLDYEVRRRVIDFNKTNQEYRIEIKEYLSDYSMEGYADAIKQMNTEIISGNCPDIIDVTDLNMQKYITRGVLEDLYPYMDADEEMSREDYLDNILRAYETEGKLYALPPSFYIDTIIGKQADFGERQSITLDELMEIAKNVPEDMELYEYATKDNILMWNTMMNMDYYVDWQTGQCSFEDEEFIKALQFANSFKRDYTFNEDMPSTPTRLRENKLLMMNVSISSVQEYQMYVAMFGEPVSFIGYPTSKGNGSLINENGVMLAMSSKSAYKDGVWQFIRSELTREAQEDIPEGGTFGFPVMKSALEKQFAMDMEESYYEDENGNKIEQPKTSWGYDDFNVEIYAATEEEIEGIRELIGSVDTLYQYDETMNGIIMEEAGAFFEGQKTAEAVADIIQSRIYIYVNENR